jgi:hypothetical protein
LNAKCSENEKTRPANRSDGADDDDDDEENDDDDDKEEDEYSWSNHLKEVADDDDDEDEDDGDEYLLAWLALSSFMTALTLGPFSEDLAHCSTFLVTALSTASLPSRP